jgi:hypothetical protein
VLAWRDEIETAKWIIGTGVSRWLKKRHAAAARRADQKEVEARILQHLVEAGIGGFWSSDAR